MEDLKSKKKFFLIAELIIKAIIALVIINFFIKINKINEVLLSLGEYTDDIYNYINNLGSYLQDNIDLIKNIDTYLNIILVASFINMGLLIFGIRYLGRSIKFNIFNIGSIITTFITYILANPFLKLFTVTKEILNTDKTDINWEYIAEYAEKITGLIEKIQNTYTETRINITKFFAIIALLLLIVSIITVIMEILRKNKISSNKKIKLGNKENQNINSTFSSLGNDTLNKGKNASKNLINKAKGIKTESEQKLQAIPKERKKTIKIVAIAIISILLVIFAASKIYKSLVPDVEYDTSDVVVNFSTDGLNGYAKASASVDRDSIKVVKNNTEFSDYEMKYSLNYDIKLDKDSNIKDKDKITATVNFTDLDLDSLYNEGGAKNIEIKVNDETIKREEEVSVSHDIISSIDDLDEESLTSLEKDSNQVIDELFKLKENDDLAGYLKKKNYDDLTYKKVETYEKEEGDPEYEYQHTFNLSFIYELNFDKDKKGYLINTVYDIRKEDGNINSKGIDTQRNPSSDNLVDEYENYLFKSLDDAKSYLEDNGFKKAE